MAIEQLKCGWCNWGIEVLLIFIFNLDVSSHTRIVAIILDSERLKADMQNFPHGTWDPPWTDHSFCVFPLLSHLLSTCAVVSHSYLSLQNSKRTSCSGLFFMSVGLCVFWYILLFLASCEHLWILYGYAQTSSGVSWLPFQSSHPNL